MDDEIDTTGNADDEDMGAFQEEESEDELEQTEPVNK